MTPKADQFVPIDPSDNLLASLLGAQKANEPPKPAMAPLDPLSMKMINKMNAGKKKTVVITIK